MWQYLTLEVADVRKSPAEASRERQDGQQESPFREVLEQVKKSADADCGLK